MSEEQLKAFLEKVQSDTELQEKLKAAATPEAALEIANEAGFAITAEDIQSMQSATVSDGELEGAAGGGSGLYGCPPASNTQGDCAGCRTRRHDPGCRTN